jgi:hypothetical protein
VRVTAISLDGTACNTSDLPTNFKIGQEKTITCTNINGATGDKYDYELVVNYTDLKVDADYSLILGDTRGQVSDACDGYAALGYCWYMDLDESIRSCATVCEAEGLTCVDGNWNDDTSWSILNHFESGINPVSPGWDACAGEQANSTSIYAPYRYFSAYAQFVTIDLQERIKIVQLNQAVVTAFVLVNKTTIS